MKSGSFDILATPIAGLMTVQRIARTDPRGFFSRFYCDEALSAAGFSGSVRQINHTLTRRSGSVRGLHFQHPPQSEDKLVSCLRGAVFDVAVDLRRRSPTFLHWHAELLSADNQCSLLIPKGFAHGFQTMVDDCELLYLHSYPYAPAAEGALNFTDPLLSIAWPLPISDVSERDLSHAFLTTDFEGLDL